MADGGWIYYPHTIYPHPGGVSDDLAMVVGMQSALEGMTNWSRHTDVASYNTRRWWFSIQHDITGARVIVVFNGSASSGVIIHADNDAFGTTRNWGSFVDNRWICYVPASFSATPLGANPATSGFLPSGSTKFFVLDGNIIRYSSGANRHQMHIMSRDDGLIIAYADSSSDNYQMDRFNMMGDCIVPRHASDTGPNAQVAHISLDGDAYNSTLLCQAYDADGTLRNSYAWYVPTAFVGMSVSQGPPWPWYSPVLYRSTTDLDNGVITGSGVKGTISSEWYRVTNAPAGPMPWYFQMDGGNFVYLKKGIAVGFDASNGGIQ